jgi:hypothetical protein
VEQGRIPSTRQQQLVSSFSTGLETRHLKLGALTTLAQLDHDYEEMLEKEIGK